MWSEARYNVETLGTEPNTRGNQAQHEGEPTDDSGAAFAYLNHWHKTFFCWNPF